MSNVAELRTMQDACEDERQARIDLAAAFRLARMADWHEGVANHFSAAISPDGKTFLMNPRWRHFSRITASELLLLDADDDATMAREDAPDLTAWCLHGRLHANLPQARCILHVHPKYATAVAGLADTEIKPIDQVTARFYNRIAYDTGFEGMANSNAEGDRLSAVLGNKRIMMMQNHGVLVVGATVAQAYDALYHLERACRTLITAYGSGQPLKIMTPEVAEQTASEWEDYSAAEFAHFSEMKRILDAREPDYAS